MKGGKICILNICHEFKLWKLLAFMCAMCMGIFPVMINTDAYVTMFMFSMISCELFPSVMSNGMNVH